MAFEIFGCGSDTRTSFHECVVLRSGNFPQVAHKATINRWASNVQLIAYIQYLDASTNLLHLVFLCAKTIALLRKLIGSINSIKYTFLHYNTHSPQQLTENPIDDRVCSGIPLWPVGYSYYYGLQHSSQWYDSWIKNIQTKKSEITRWLTAERSLFTAATLSLSWISGNSVDNWPSVTPALLASITAYTLQCIIDVNMAVLQWVKSSNWDILCSIPGGKWLVWEWASDLKHSCTTYSIQVCTPALMQKKKQETTRFFTNCHRVSRL